MTENRQPVTCSWEPYRSGSTTGQRGSENGEIVVDDEYRDGVRITLEREAMGPPGWRERAIPFSITCGIYGRMVHTRIFSEEIQARTQLDEMKKSLGILVDQLLDEESNGDDRDALSRSDLDEFVRQYPLREGRTCESSRSVTPSVARDRTA
jgi:hypothetical protein